MLTCWSPICDGRHVTFEELIEMSELDQYNAVIGICPYCGSVSTEY